MNRAELSGYILQKYNCAAEYPWPKYPSYAVYRHKTNQKWFAVIMEIPAEKLSLSGKNIEIVNLKCDPLILGSLINDEGIYRAYHMSKTHWISALLDGSVEDEKLKWLVDLSFSLTDKGGQQKRK